MGQSLKKACLLAGGTGSRLGCLVKSFNKHLLPVGNKPMIYYPIDTLKSLGATSILIVTGGNHLGGFLDSLGDGSDFEVSFTYKIQKEPNGIAGALLLAEEFIGDSGFPIILGDNLFLSSTDYTPAIEALNQNKATIVLKEVENPSRFGVAEFSNNKIIKIIEKPVNPPSNMAVTGLYFYPSDVFNFIKKLEPSTRGELEISSINNMYLNEERLNYINYKGFWSDAGVPESLKFCNNYLNNI